MLCERTVQAEPLSVVPLAITFTSSRDGGPSVRLRFFLLTTNVENSWCDVFGLACMERGFLDMS